MGRTARISSFVMVAGAALIFAACEGPAGPAGSTGPAGTAGEPGTKGADGNAAPTTGTLSGTITDATAKDALAGVTVKVKDSGGKELNTAMTDATGKYSVTAPIGTVLLSLSKDKYTSPADLLVGVLGGQTVTINATLAESADGRPSVVLMAAGADVGYGATTMVSATATDPNGDTLTYKWTNATTAGLGSVVGNGAMATVTTPTLADAMKPRVEDPTKPLQYINPAPLADRFGIIPITADTRGTVSVSVAVSDGRGQSVNASVGIDAASILTGVHNVAIGTRVYLNSGHDANNAWTLTLPQGSAAKLDATDARTPSFVADIKGTYTVTEGQNSMDIYAGDWVGAVGGATDGGVTPDPTCTQCHDDQTAPDKFTPWAKTGHANKLFKGMTGLNGASYGASCIVCHTVGNDPGVANGGFDDLAAKDKWTFPATKSVATWLDFAAKFPDLLKLSGIQCENCHGPNGSAAHRLTNKAPYTSPRIAFSGEVCGTCHASGTGHHLYSEWNSKDPKSGMSHSNRADAVGLGTRGGTFQSHCGRCHTAQGYVQYSAQLLRGDIGNLVTTAGVNPGNVEPVTCSACHDPHSVANPNHLRVYGDTPLLPGGFALYGIGKGALCVTCHNSRNGAQNGSRTATFLHEDGETYNGGNPTGYSAPHQACQGDVFAGRNAYFLGGSLPMTSKHAAIEDACVGCHMEKNPEQHTSHGTPATSTHAFRITDDNKGSLCPECHGEGVNGEGVQASVEAGIKSIAAQMGAAMVKAVNGAAGNKVTLVAYDAGSDLYSIAPNANPNPGNLLPLQVDVSLNPLVSAAVVEIHGQIGFNFTFTNPVNVQFVDSKNVASGAPKSTKTFGVQLGSIMDVSMVPQPLFALSGNLVRAGWNYFLIEGDQSLGIHNPTFVRSVITATLARDLSK